VESHVEQAVGLVKDEELRGGVDVLVATPGRLLDLVQQGIVDLAAVEFLVLDEADRMLDMGFIQDVRRIVALLPRERQTLLFSATLPAAVRELAAALLRRPLEVRTAPQATPAETVEQSVFFVPQQQKRHLLVHLLTTAAMPRTIVFTRTKHGADKLKRVLEKSGIRTAAIHGDKSQNHRERALAAFKSHEPPVLVATDVAARGIDVDHVSHVVNFDLPHEPETYVHRIGRTGRAGMTGAAVSLCDREERPRLQAIERLLGRAIPVRDDVPSLPAVEESAEPRPPRRSAGRGGESRGRRRADAGRKPANDGNRSSGTAAAKPAVRRGRNRYRRAL
ncbi:MAG: DEAD/DEAH box helicase, partial [Planctomycetia bacterium]